MKLFEKLKNVLFEEEEIVIPVKEPERRPEVVQAPIQEKKIEVTESIKKGEEKPLIREIPKKSIPKVEPKVEIDEIDSDFIERDIFNPKKTFEFPVFDASDFEDTKNFKRGSIKDKKDSKVSFGRFEEIKPEKKEEFKNFTPSLVISPVYGVLDQNYKKEDIVTKSEASILKKGAISIDAIRNKAYGTLEDEIESILPSKDEIVLEEEFEEDDIDITSPKKTIDDLLLDSIDETITINDESDIVDEQTIPEEMEEASKTMDVLSEIEQELDKREESSKLENDTLESDLFNLIDSMYEKREDGE